MLPDIPVVLSNSKSFVGAVTYKKKRLTGAPYDFKLRISTRMDLPEEEVQDTIIHEMIHYYIALNHIKDTSSHGKVFRSIMGTINSKFGRHIKISHRPTAEQREEARDKRYKPHIVAVITLKDGFSGIKVIPPTPRSLKTFDRALRRATSVSSLSSTSSLSSFSSFSSPSTLTSLEYYLTLDPFFNSYPSSSALRLYPADLETVRSHLVDATKI